MENRSDDVRLELIDHITKVQSLIKSILGKLIARSLSHDKSKLESPEFDVFVEWVPKLKDIEYGSDEYKNALAQMKPALDHHYRCNSHHPESHPNGVDDMNLVDLVEMVCDWIASSQRTKNGNFSKSLEINAKRFNLTPQLVQIIANTARDLE